MPRLRGIFFALARSLVPARLRQAVEYRLPAVRTPAATATRSSKATSLPRRYNPRMDIFLNGQPHAVDADISLAQLLETAGYAQRRVAVEINREIVPRSAQATRLLREGDRVEIVHAIGGG